MPPELVPTPLDALLAQQDWVRALAPRLVDDTHDAAEIEQRVWTSAVARPPEQLASPRGWLTVALRNAARKLARSRARREKYETDAPPARAPRDPAELAALAELQQRVARAVSDLPPKYRDVVLLRYFEGLEPAEIAERLDAPVETVRTRHRRALERLRRRLDDLHGDDRRAWAGVLVSWIGWERGGGSATRTAAAAGGGALAASLLIGLAASVLLAVGWMSADGPVADGGGSAPGGGPIAGAVRGDGESRDGGDAASTTKLVRGTSLTVIALRAGAPVRADVSIHRDPPVAGPEPRAELWDRLRTVLSDGHVESVAAGPVDERGVLRIDDLEPGAYTVWAVQRNGGSARAGVSVSDAEQEVTVHLPETEPRLHGSVLLNGAVPEHARIAVVSAGWDVWTGPRPAWQPITRDGRFAWHGTRLARARVLVATGTAVHRSDPVDLPRTEAFLVHIEDGAEQRGRVVSSLDGSPLAGAQVTWVSASTQAFGRTRTGPSGRFSARLTSPSRVTAQAEGFAPATREDPRSDRQLELDLELDPVVSIAGRVRTESGDSVSGAEVSAIEFLRARHRFVRRATSAADGTFTIDDIPPGRTRVFVLDPNWASVGLETIGAAEGANVHVLEVPADGLRGLELRVRAAGRTTIRAQDDEGRPVSGARITLHGDLTDVAPKTAVTGDDGRVSFGGLVPGLLYSIQAERDAAPSIWGTGTFRATGVTHGTGDGNSTHLVALRPVRWFDVRVVDEATGAPIPGARLRRTFSTRPDRWRTEMSGPLTDGEGRARIDFRFAHRCGVTPSATGYEPFEERMVWLPDDGSETSIRLRRGQEVRGRIVLPDGLRPADVRLSLRHADGWVRRDEREFTVKEDGSFSISGLPAGRFDATFLGTTAQGLVAASTSVDAPSSGHVLELRLSESSKDAPTLRVFSPDGEPVRDAAIATRAGGSRTGGGLHDGAHQLGEVRLATHVVVSRPRDAQGRPRPWGHAVRVVKPGDGPEVELRLPRERTLTGHLRTPSGKPVAGALIVAFAPEVTERRPRRSLPWARNSTDGVASAFTGPDGRFTLRQLGPTDVDLHVTTPPQFVPPEDLRTRTDVPSLELVARERSDAMITIRDPTGTPLAGAEVAVWRSLDEGDPSPLTSARTGREGTVTLVGLDPEQTLVLTVRPGSRGDLRRHTVRAWRPAPTEIRLDSAAEFAGVVLDESEQPVAGANVRLVHGPKRASVVAATDARGRFAFGGLDPTGPFRFTASGTTQPRPESEWTIERSGTDRDLRLVLPGPLVRLRVDGNVDPSRQVSVLLSCPGTPSREEYVDGTRSGIVLAGLDPNARYAVRLHVLGTALVGTGADLRASTDGLPVRVALRPGLSITGRVVGATPRELDFGDVSVARAGDVRSTHLDRGRFRFEGLTPGKWTVTFRESRARGEIVVAAGAEDVELVVTRTE